MKCPKCGQTKTGFTVTATIGVYVDGDGEMQEMDIDSIDWDTESLTVCVKCEHPGKFEDFEDKGS